MGVGKSTIANFLSKKMQIPSLDTDKIIENKVGLKVSEIFNQRGEIYFRKLEHDVFNELIESHEPMIISTGGGTPCYANNHVLLQKKDVVSIYLKASIETLYDRLISEKSHRPLVTNETEETLKEYIAKNLFDRSYYYNQSKYTIKVDGKTPEVIVNEIVELLH